MTCPNCGHDLSGNRCPYCGHAKVNRGNRILAVVLLILLALPSALCGGCAVAVGAYSLFGPGGFWSGMPSIVFGLLLIGVFFAIFTAFRRLWR